MQHAQPKTLIRDTPVNPTADDNAAASLQVLKPVLTLTDVAKLLRCSKAHVSNIVRGKVPDLSPLPVIRIGRRALVRHESLIEWMKALEYKPDGVRQCSKT